MSEYDNSLRGALFKNEDKRPDKKDPDYRGNAEVDGVEYWLDAWLNTAKDSGKKYLSIKFKRKEQPAPKAAKPIASEPADFNDDIPF